MNNHQGTLIRVREELAWIAERSHCPVSSDKAEKALAEINAILGGGE